ncbi:hypothetical protein L1889_03475 [Paenalcaligenes niemegkensis]|uniref:hypothetical protein n=1 Tax=Paenalcaligenes niemegkensis TaxID=2895469 RepID=UPI001EE9AAC6|nr:hypothetical protein [Paenalcaligenes niemegkensis]MCQ9615876.1 hypothetical protein [Paenalcaligenes niemegkensis]
MQLNRHYARLKQRLSFIEREIDELAAKRVLAKREVHALEKYLVQLQIEWEHFIRRLILDSATGQYQDTSGRVFSKLLNPPKTREQALYTLLSTFKNKNRGREPEWSHSTKAIDAATRLQLSNLTAISGYLGVTPWPLDQMRFLRNYIAHQSKNSAVTLRRQSMTSSSGKISVVQIAFDYTPSGVQRYKEWPAFMKTIAQQIV